jgi:hypothetical protein
MRQVAQVAAQHIVRGDAAHGEAAAVQVQQHRQGGPVQRGLLRRVQARRQRMAVAGREVQVFHAGQLVRGSSSTPAPAS